MTQQHPEDGQAKILVHLDPDLEAIVPGFLANRQRDLLTIDACMKRGDLDTISILGHRMKGDGGGYGFDQISTIGDQIEQAALKKDLITLQQQYEHLQDFLARITIVYKP